MKTSITTRQKELLRVIYDYLQNTGFPPSFEEMREKLGFSSNQSVIDHLKKLEDGGFVQRNAAVARGLILKPSGYEVLGEAPLAPFLGMTTAGIPAEAIEITGQWQQISRDVARLADKVSLFKVFGDSMINAGINDGDVVLVKDHKEFVSGDVVLAQIAGESTVKRFISDDKPPFVYLKPENPKYKPLPFTEEVQLVGKVLSVVRQGLLKPIR